MRLSGLRHLLPTTLFGRLALLLLAFALAGHLMALTAMFELIPHPHGPHGPPGGPHAEAAMLILESEGRPPLMPLGLLLDVGVRLAVVVLAAWIAANWIARPIKRLAVATQALGQGLGVTANAPLPDEGPLECREASQGFNRMQAQIVGHLQERDRFVAAVSHDLRTPLTRLRLRAEDLSDPAQQQKFQRDIAEMEATISSTLDYFRGAAVRESLQRLDVQALAESLAQDQQACGHDVQVNGHAGPWLAAPSALRRGLVNLVDNAVRYGGSAVIELQEAGDALRLTVRDHGPGIPEAELARVLEPYYRLEASRNRSTGGVGLGLSIAQDIARQHRGTLTLCNAPAGGLLATLTLPR